MVRSCYCYGEVNLHRFRNPVSLDFWVVPRSGNYRDAKDSSDVQMQSLNAQGHITYSTGDVGRGDDDVDRN
jgi:hypothetical protein